VKFNPSEDGGTTQHDDSGTLTGQDGGSLLGGPKLQSIAVSPGTVSIESLNGAQVTQAFSVIGTFDNGTTTPLTAGVSWTADQPQVGIVNGASGLFTASGALGGVVTVQAAVQGDTASATLTVKLHLQTNGGSVPGAVQTQLQGASAPDASVVWAYPYDGTLWPRGLLPPVLQWNGGAATDDYYVHLVSSTFELDDFTTATGAPSSQVALDATTWEKFVDSTSGATQVTVSRWDGSAATLLANHTWTIAPASMRGTIYYWSNNLGRVLRIQPGAAQPDDFANAPPLNDPSQYPTGGCLMTCHTVSADGSTIISGGGMFGGSYDLKTNTPIYSFGYGWGTSATCTS
jgi:hypothetical protein